MASGLTSLAEGRTGRRRLLLLGSLVILGLLLLAGMALAITGGGGRGDVAKKPKQEQNKATSTSGTIEVTTLPSYGHTAASPTAEETTATTTGSPSAETANDPEAWEQEASGMYRSSLFTIRNLLNIFDPSQRDQWTEQDYAVLRASNTTFRKNYSKAQAMVSPPELQAANQSMQAATYSLYTLQLSLSGKYVAYAPQHKDEESHGESPYLGENTGGLMKAALDSLTDARKIAGYNDLNLDPNGTSPDPEELAARIDSYEKQLGRMFAEEEAARQASLEAQWQEAEALNQSREPAYRNFERVVANPEEHKGATLDIVGQVSFEAVRVQDPDLVEGTVLTPDSTLFLVEAAPGGPLWQVAVFTNDANLATASTRLNEDVFVHLQGTMADTVDSALMQSAVPLIRLSDIDTISKDQVLDPAQDTFEVR